MITTDYESHMIFCVPEQGRSPTGQLLPGDTPARRRIERTLTRIYGPNNRQVLGSMGGRKAHRLGLITPPCSHSEKSLAAGRANMKAGHRVAIERSRQHDDAILKFGLLYEQGWPINAIVNFAKHIPHPFAPRYTWSRRNIIRTMKTKLGVDPTETGVRAKLRD